MNETKRIYTVWGPTAEWGDGSGPLYYSDSLKACGYYVRDERRTTIDHATQIDKAFASADSEGITRDYRTACDIVGWPMNIVDYSLDCDSAEDVARRSGFDGSIFDADGTLSEDFFDFLNGGW